MKRIVSMFTAALLVTALCSPCVVAKQNDNDGYLSELSALVQEYSDENYFGTMSVTIGETNLIVDGEEVPIDNNGTVAYVENGRTMMPVRAIAEAMGADVYYADDTQTVTVESDEKIILMSIDESEMSVNGETVQLLNAPEIVNDRTMLPVRDVAEALDCEVSWDQETETATFTRPLQTKRLIVFSNTVNMENAVAAVRGNGYMILQFDTIVDASEYIEKYGDLVLIEPDYIQKTDSLSWGTSRIGSESYYNQVSSVVGSATVAVIDSGIDYSHPVFQNRIVEGHDFWYDDNYCEDSDGHGTHVASIVLDVAGFNGGIKIMPLKVFGSEDSTPSSMVAAAIDYAADHGASVINLSLGGMHRSEIEKMAINNAVSKNVAVIAAAGNEQTDLRYVEYSPGGLDGVITISSIDSNNNLARTSNYGDGVIDFAAPGVSINGARNGGGYITMSGTSMATPHVAGAYGLVMSANPKLSVDEVTNALKANAKAIGSSHYFGAGMIHLANLERILPVDLGESKLRIEMTALPDSVKQGNNFGLRGTVRSNYPLTTVKGYIKRGNDVVQSSTDTPSGTSMDVKNANLNNKLIFNNLSVGEYELLIEATDASGNTKTVSKDFNVYVENKESSLTIDLTSYPSSIKQGEGYGLRGSVISNYNITEVRGYVINSYGNTVLSSADYPNSTSMDIRYAHLNNDLVFNNLSAGSYTMKVVASDASGKQVQTTKEFKVVAVEEKKPDSDLTINLTSYPSSINQGSAYGLRGTVTSNYSVTKVLGYIINSSGNTVMTSEDYPNSTSMDIRYAHLNNDLIFNNLSAGNYTMKVVAADTSGKTKEWSTGFTVNGVNSSVKTGVINIPSSWDNLSIRTGPGTSYQIIGSMNQGERCTVYTDRTSNGWYYVEYNGITGYASGRQINLQ